MGACWWVPAGLQTTCRVDVPARALGAHVRTLGTDALETEHSDGGVAVFRHPFGRREIDAMTWARRLGARVLVDVDDYVLGQRMRRSGAMRFASLLDSRARLEEHIAVIGAGQEVFVEALELADGVTVASRALVDAYRPHNPHIYLVANQVDPADWPQPTKRPDRVFRVGFAGTREHVNDIHLVRDALAWAAGRDGVEVVFAGWHPGRMIPNADLKQMLELAQAADQLGVYDPNRTRLRKQALAVTGRQRRRWAFPITVLPWADAYRTYAANLAAFDVGLCPADDDAAAFTRYRSDLKPLEYAMAGALPIVSRSRAYADWWDRVPTADGPEQFETLVRWAVANPGEVRERALELRGHVLAKRTIEANLWRWDEALRGAAR